MRTWHSWRGHLPVGSDVDGSDAAYPITVGAALARVKGELERTPRLWIEGEVARWHVAPSGHCYFDLRDSTATAAVVMYRGVARALPAAPRAGTRVLMFARPSLHPPQARFQFVAERLHVLDEDGAYRLAFEALKRRLAAEGLFALERKRKLPPMPARIAVVTSPNGAAWTDFRVVVERRAPWTRLVLCPTPVEGEAAAPCLAASTRTASRLPGVDLVVLARGGGSPESLRGFDAESVVRAIRASPVPVLAAIGHERDLTLAELAADARAGTPSEAATLAVPSRDDLLERLAHVQARMVARVERAVREAERQLDLGGRLTSALRSCLHRAEARLAALGREPLGRGLVRLLRRSEERLGRVSEAALRASVLGYVERRERALAAVDRDRLLAALRRVLQRNEGAVAAAATQLELLSPLRTLARGYAILESATGQLVRSVEEVAVGSILDARVSDGRIRSRVEGVTFEEVDREGAAAGGIGPEHDGARPLSGPSGANHPQHGPGRGGA